MYVFCAECDNYHDIFKLKVRRWLLMCFHALHPAVRVGMDRYRAQIDNTSV